MYMLTCRNCCKYISFWCLDKLNEFKTSCVRFNYKCIRSTHINLHILNNGLSYFYAYRYSNSIEVHMQKCYQNTQFEKINCTTGVELLFAYKFSRDINFAVSWTKYHAQHFHPQYFTGITI